MKNKLISILTVLGLMGGVGAINYDKIQFAYIKYDKCHGQEVQIETEINGKNPYLCGSQIYYNNVKEDIKRRLVNNSMQKSGEGEEVVSDYAGAVMVARNDPELWSDVKDILLSKYDPVEKRFDGSKFDYDLREQLAFYKEIANIKCGGKCGVIGETTNEQLYNLIK